jgi:hypothetical protein
VNKLYAINIVLMMIMEKCIVKNVLCEKMRAAIVFGAKQIAIITGGRKNMNTMKQCEIEADYGIFS